MWRTVDESVLYANAARRPSPGRSLARQQKLRLAAAIVPLGMLLQSAQAANDAWSTSPGSANFSGANWTANVTAGGAPGGNIASGNSLYFDASTITTLTNDESTGFNIGGVTFNSDAAGYTIGGNSFNLSGGISNLSSNNQIIGDAIVLTGANTAISSTSGTVTLSGGLSLSGTLTSSGAGTINISGGITTSGTASVLTANGTSTLIVTNASGANDTFATINGASGSTVILSGADSTAMGTISSTLSSSGQTVDFTGGTWTLNGGGSYTSAMIINGGAVTRTGSTGDFNDVSSLTIHSGSLTNNGQYNIRIGSLYGANNNTGLNFTVLQDGGTFTANTGIELGSSTTGVGGTFTLSGGTLSVSNVNGGAPNEGLTIGAGISGGVGTTFALSGTGNLLATLIQGAQGSGAIQNFTFNGGTLSAGTVNMTNLTTSGATTGVASTLTNAGGTVAPGGVGTAGRTNITGNYNVTSSSASLAIDIGGAAQANTFQNASGYYDFLSVSGSATLGGTLSVDLINSFVPTPGSTLTVLQDTGNVAGSFTNIASGGVIATPDGKALFQIAYGSNNTIVLTTLVGAGTSTWAPTGGGTWGTAGNWTNSTVPSGAGTGAYFASSITSPSTVTLDTNYTVGTLVFNNSTASYTISPGAGPYSLTLNNNSSASSITDLSGSQTINPAIAVAGTNNLNIAVTRSTDTLTLGGNVTLSGTLTTSGAGTIAMTGGITTSGATLTANGTSTLSLTQASGTSNTFATINGASGSTVILGGATSTALGAITNILNTPGQTVDFTGGTWTLNGGGSYTSAMIINGGSVTRSPATGDFYQINSLTIHNGSLNSNGQYGIRIGNQFGANNGAGTNNNFTVLQDGGTFTATTGIELGSVSSGLGGTFTLSGGTLSVSGGNNGMNIGAGTTGGVATTFALSGTGTLLASSIQGSQGSGAVQNFTFNGGTLSAGTVNMTNLTTSGATTGVASTLTNAGGTLAPGGVGTAGKTNITGNYNVTSSSASLAIDIGGTSQANTFQNASGYYDFMSISGSATMGGTLSVDLINSFVPTAGSTFTILQDTGNVAGSFTNIASGGVIATPDGNALFQIAYGSNNTIVLNTLVGAGFSTWGATGGGTWGTAGNWTNSTVPSGAGTGAYFASSITSSSTVTLDTNYTVGALVFNNSTAGYTISPGTGYSLTLNNNSSASSITDLAGSHTINAPITVAGTNNLSMAVTRSTDTLTLGGNVTLPGTLTTSGAGTIAVTGGITTSGATLTANGTSTLSVTQATGTNNTFTTVNGASGATIILGGTDTSAVGNISNPISTNGLTVDFTGGTWNLGVSGNGGGNYSANLIINGGTVTKIANSGDFNDIRSLTIHSGSLTSNSQYNIRIGNQFGANNAGGTNSNFTVLQDGGTFTATTGIELGTISSGLGGTFTLSGGTLSVSGGQGLNIGAPTDGSGTTAFSMNGGTLLANQIQGSQGAGAIQNFIFNGGTLSAGSINMTDLTTSGPTANASTFLYNNGGTLAPGGVGTAGRTIITGYYSVLSPSASLAIDIGGADPANTFQNGSGYYDYLNVSGLATLGGTLSVDLINGFVPATGSNLTILQSGFTVGGNFSNVSNGGLISTPDSKALFQIAYGSNTQVVLTTLAGSGVGIWVPATGGSWGTAANWSTNAVPDAVGAGVCFGPNLATSGTVALDANHTVGTILFANSAASYTISPGTGPYSLTLNNNASASSISDILGSQAINAAMTVAGNNNLNVIVTRPTDTLTLGGNVALSGTLTTSGAGTIAMTGGITTSGTAAVLTANGSSTLSLTQASGSNSTFATVNGNSGATIVLGGADTSAVSNISSPMNTPGLTVDFTGGTWNLGTSGNGGGNYSANLIIDGGAVTKIANSGDFNGINSLTIHSGSLTSNSQYNIRVGSLYGAANANGFNFTGLQDGGTLTATTGFELGSASMNVGGTYAFSGGTISVSGGAGLNIGAATMGGGTTAFSMSGGTLLASNIQGSQGSGAIQNFIFNGGTLSAGTVNMTNLTTSGATTGVASTLTNNGGTLAPGGVGTAGRTNITGNYSVTSSSASLAIDIGGATQANNFQNASGYYDYLNISGSATMGGTLAVDLINSFVPTIGSTLTIAQDTGAITGSFTNVANAGLISTPDNKALFQVAYGSNNQVVLTTLAGAGSSIWGLTGGGTWGVSGNWTNNTVPSGAGLGACFGPSITSPSTITLDTNYSLGTITFANTAASYTINPGAGPYSITLNNSGSASVINDALGSHTINAPITVAGTNNLNVAVTRSTDTLTLGNVALSGTLTTSGAGTIAVTGGITTSGATLTANGTSTLSVTQATGTNNTFTTINGSSGATIILGGTDTSAVGNISSPMNTPGLTVDFTGGTWNLGTSGNGGGSYSANLIINGGAVTKIANSGDFNGINSLTIHSGSLTSNSQYNIRIGSLYNAASTSGVNFTARQDGGTFTATTGFELGSASSNVGGTFTLSGGTLSIGGGNGLNIGAPTDSSGTTAFSMTGGTLLATQVQGSQGAGAIQNFIFNGGTLSAGSVNMTNLTTSGPTSGSASILFNGGGTLAPGGVGTAGRTNITGYYAVTSSAASLAIDIGGANQANAFQNGSGYYDYLNVSGLATLGGSLSVDLINGFVPTTGSTFTILQDSFNVAGNFTNVSNGDVISTPDSKAVFQVAYGSTTQVVLTTLAGSGTPIWASTTGGSWGTAGNWSTNSVPDGAGASVWFGTALTASDTVALDANHTVGTIVFANSNASYTISPGTGPYGLTLNNNASASSISDLQGSHAVNAPITVAGNNNLNLSVTRPFDTLTLGGGVTLSGTLTTSGAGTVAITGSIPAGPGSVTVDGNGTLILSNSNAYTGNTTVNSGTLKLATISNNNNIASSPNIILATGSTLDTTGLTLNTGSLTPAPGLILASGQSLYGNGTVNGALTVASGSKISAGTSLTSTNGTGLLSTGSQTWNSGGIYVWKTSLSLSTASTWSLTEAGVMSAANQDLLAIGSGGTLAINSGFILDIVQPGGKNLAPPVVPETFIIANVASGGTVTVNGTAESAGYTLPANEFTVYDGNNGNYGYADTATLISDSGGGTDLEITVTPEPGSLGLLGITSLGLLRRRRANRLL